MIQGLAGVDKVGQVTGMLDGLANITGPALNRPNVAPEATFAAALSAASGQAISTLRNAEGLSVQALQGEADTREVVDAVMSAEQTLQAAIAIRDKIVSSYLEISRMAI
jgi:flagellar hook-basal body complex protein FliE